MFTYHITCTDGSVHVEQLETKSFREAMLKISNLKKTVANVKRIQVTRDYFEDVYDTDLE